MNRRWSKEDLALLALKYSNSSWTELFSFFPGRTKRAIEKKAQDLELKRSKFSTKKGTYFVYGICPRHGRILRENIKWEGKHENIPYCPRPYCKKRLRVMPRDSKLRRKYRIEERKKNAN